MHCPHVPLWEEQLMMVRREYFATRSNLCICDIPKEIRTELCFKRMVNLWTTFRHTLPACARK